MSDRWLWDYNLNGQTVKAIHFDAAGERIKSIELSNGVHLIVTSEDKTAVFGMAVNFEDPMVEINRRRGIANDAVAARRENPTPANIEAEEKAKEAVLEVLRPYWATLRI